MSIVEQRQVMIEPIINYPSEAQAGKSYIMTIDLQMTASYKDWPFDEEEYPIWFILDTDPLFSYEPFDKENTAVVLHRFGGTYGPATFLLTAAQQEMKGTLSIVLINDWGIPIGEIKVDSTIIAANPTISESPPVTYAQTSQPLERKEGFYQEDTFFNRSQNTLPVPIQVFCLFADVDALLLEQLEHQLSVFKREGLISTWHKRQIAAESNWQMEQDRRLNTAALILLLISPVFVTSDYYDGVEMQWVMQRYEAGDARVIPILLRPVNWQHTPFGKLKALPSNGKPITQWNNHDAAFEDVARGIRVVLDDIQHLSPSSMLSGVWNVPYRRNPYFTGREELLDRLDQQLSPEVQEHGTAVRLAALTPPLAIKGLGGVGKTQIAVEYAYRSRDQGRYTHTLWIDAASEETIIAGFVTIAELLPAFSAKNETDQQKLVEAVKRWLERCQWRWLLIFDNVDDVALVHPFLPKAGPGHILLTTRAQAVGSLAASIEVEKMSLMEGLCLLLLRVYGLDSHLSPMQVLEYASAEDTNEAGNIVAVLDYLPLALDQAGAYIEETRCGFADYLNIYSTHRKELLARRGIQDTNYPDVVATTWSLSFLKVEQANPAAAELLHLCAFLAPDRIPEELITDCAAYWPSLLQQASADLFAFHQMIAELLKFSLIERLAETQTLKTFRIHRLVQAVNRDTMELEEQREWAERVVRAVNKVFPNDSSDIATWPQCLRYLDQVQACNNLVEHYMLTFIEAADLLNRAGFYLSAHAAYFMAEALFQQALAIQEQQLEPLHPDIAISLNGLATLYCEQGKYAEAEPLYQRALHILEQSLGPEHPQVASSLNGLATLYCEQGKYAEAEPLYQRALHILEQSLGPEHPQVASSLNGLATLYREQGKYAEAEPLYQRALHIWEQSLGPEHPQMASSLNGLANLYCEQGKYAEAEPLYQRALHIWEQRLGPEHPNIAISLSNLATLYREQGKYAEAEPLYQRALRIWEQSLGPEHHQMAYSLSNLATLYCEQGKYAEAEPLYQRALHILEQQLGPEHPDIASSLSQLALLYQQQKQYNKAEPLYARALHILEHVLGPPHPQTRSLRVNYASFLRAMGRESEAIQEETTRLDAPSS